ncbi:MAG: alkaline phosphatase family protein [Opitutus sp.]|nr:alkaline phosphatase family protein [Opitutus sp.]
MKSFLPALILLLVPALHAVPDRSLLLISIDGLRTDYLAEADRHGLKVPHLRELWAAGVHASSVLGALPTSTYPSHTTLITGTSPARHGIASNQPFSATGETSYRWYWYSEDMTSPPLWEAAAAAGYEVGSVSWPVTVGAKGIKYNIADFTGTRSDEDAKMIRAWAGREFIDELARDAGVLLTDANLGTKRDWARTRYILGIIRTKKPRFMITHFVAADHHQHKTGPFSAPALAAIEEIDEMVGQIVEAMRREYPNAAVCVVSDHGFSGITHALALQDAFVRAGLITLKSKQRTLEMGGVQDWVAFPWEAGGSAAIVLKNPEDADAQRRTRLALDTLAADSANGIVRILDREQIAQLGGTSRADFWVDLKPGFSFSPLLGGSTVLPSSRGGTHGHVPTHPEMSSTFVFVGPGVRQGDVGAIDMRSIAPTLAKFLQVPLPTAELPALDVFNPASR